MRIRPALAMTIALLLVLPMLAGQIRVAAQDSERPTLRYGLNAADLGTLDPHFASSTNDRTVVDMVFNGLVRYQPGNSAVIEPDLATAVPDPETTADGKQIWTFQLRQGVMCHPGPQTESYELTADDVVYSLQKSANKDRSAFAGEYTGMTFEKVDQYTVRITLERPLSSTLFLPKVADYAGGFIVCSKAIEAMGDEAFKTHPVGTGPFMFQEYTPQTAIKLVAFDQYFRGAPKLAGVELRFMPDATSRELGLQAGDLDVAEGLPEAQWVERINATGTLKADVFGVGEVSFVNINVTKPPFDNLLVRQAIAYAINRDDHVALFGAPIAEPVYSVVPAQLLPGGLTREEAEARGVLYEQDLDKAKALMAEAGYADGFSVELITSEMPVYRKNYEVLQAELAEIGIEIKLNVVAHATMHEQIRKDVNPIVIYVAWRPNADAYLTRFFHSDSIVVTGAKPDTNFSHYDKIDELIEQARYETDPEKQVELWKQANEQILRDVAAYPILFTNQVYARTTAVDYGHELISSLALYPQITEQTTISRS
jgi:peptide/nickel transport system substrate-binding protein